MLTIALTAFVAAPNRSSITPSSSLLRKTDIGTLTRTSPLSSVIGGVGMSIALTKCKETA